MFYYSYSFHIDLYRLIQIFYDKNHSNRLKSVTHMHAHARKRAQTRAQKHYARQLRVPCVECERKKGIARYVIKCFTLSDI